MPRRPIQLVFQVSPVFNSTNRMLDGVKQDTMDEDCPKLSPPSKDKFPLNRQMALAITVPICFLVLLAVLAVVVYCSRTRRSSRQSSPRNVPEHHRNNFADALGEAIAQPHRNYGAISRTCIDDHDQQRPTTAVRSSSHASPYQFSSTAVELGEALDSGASRDSLYRRVEESHTSSSTLPHTGRSVDSSSDDDFVGSHFSGLEDPFSDSAAVKSSRLTRLNQSSPVSPTTHPEQHGPRDVAIAGTDKATRPTTPRTDSPKPQTLQRSGSEDLLRSNDKSSTTSQPPQDLPRARSAPAPRQNDE